jgi:hypothetical protein
MRAPDVRPALSRIASLASTAWSNMVLSPEVASSWVRVVSLYLLGMLRDADATEGVLKVLCDHGH